MYHTSFPFVFYSVVTSFVLYMTLDVIHTPAAASKSIMYLDIVIELLQVKASEA
jgi:hypothetical protein